MLNIAISEKAKEKEYWLNQLSGDFLISSFCKDNNLTKQPNKEYSILDFELSEITNNQLLNFCKKSEHLLHIVTMACVNILLKRYLQHNEIIIGTPILKQNSDNNLINKKIIIKSSVDESLSFKDYLINTKQLIINATKNQNFPINSFFSGLKDSKNRNYDSLYDVGLVIENIHDKDYLKEDKPNVIFIFEIDNEQVKCHILFNEDLYFKDTIKRISNHLIKIIETFLSNPNQRISDVELISKEEKKWVLDELNNTKSNYSKDKTISQIFVEQANKTPDNIALEFEGKKLRYKELDEMSNQIANILLTKGIQNEDIVGVLLERGFELIICILGILKSGGAYLPLDLDYPEDRLNYMLKDSESKCLITTKDCNLSLNYSGELIHYNKTDLVEIPGTSPAKTYESENLMYIIYTSGSTGRPKGVMVEHKNVMNLFFNQNVKFDFNENDVWTMFHSHCFDFSVWEMYGALLFGGRLIIIPRMLAMDTSGFLQLLKKEKVTILNQTPTAFYYLSEKEIESEDNNLNLRYVIFGGEALQPGKLKKWYEKYPQIKLVNMFGITETTIHVTYKEIEVSDINSGISNIGNSLPGMSSYVMDMNKKLQPIGIPGELYVGGEGVARAYLNNEKLTKEKFIENPYKKSEKLYKTGDLVKQLPDGNIEFIGRIDDQIQLRGFRIELGEIENCLLKHKLVNEVAVVTKMDDKKNICLCAYIVLGNSEGEIDVPELRNHISNYLPDYMIPSFMIKINELPLTLNGKIDKEALSDIVVKSDKTYIAPSNKIEAELAEIWASILNISKEQIGLNDNFFELGGHSLKATFLTLKINKKFNVRITIEEIFSNQTIGELSAIIQSKYTHEFKSLNFTEEKEYYDLSTIQKGLFYLWQLNTASTVYNIPIEISLEKQVSHKKVKEIFNLLIKRHEIFSTGFFYQNSGSVMRFNTDDDISIDFIEANENEIDNIKSSFVRPFDLFEPPIYRICHISVKNSRSIIFFDVHHIIMDGISSGILLEEFVKLLNGESLSKHYYRYKDYIEWQKLELKQNKNNQSATAREKNINIPKLDFLYDYPASNVSNFEGKSDKFNLPESTVKILKQIAKENNGTLYQVLLAAFNILISKIGQEEEIVVGTTTAGRDHDDLNNIIGVFINTIPIKSVVSGKSTFKSFLHKLIEMALKMLDSQRANYEELQKDTGAQKTNDRGNNIEVAFNMQNQYDDITLLNDNNIKISAIEDKITHFNLLFVCGEANGIVDFKVEYCRHLFKNETIKTYIKYYLKIINSICNNPDITIDDIEIVDDEIINCNRETKKLNAEFNF